MKASPEELELFEILKKYPSNNLNQYQIGDKFRRSPGDLAVKLLAARGMLSLEVGGRELYHKLEKFNEAVLAGGLQQWIDQEKEKAEATNEFKKAETKLINSNLGMNKVTRISLYVSGGIGILTLLTLVVQIYLASSQSYDSERLLNTILENNKALQIEHQKLSTDFHN